MRVGVNYASKYKPDWLLFLDDDTVPMDNAVGRVLGLINNLPRFVLDRVGAVLMGSVDGDCGIGEVRYGVFSGTLVRADVAVRVCCRDDFFLDQADHDMYSRIRELGYITLGINCRLVNHRLGTMRLSKILHFVEFRYNATIDGGASTHGIDRFVTKVGSVKLSTLGF